MNLDDNLLSGNFHRLIFYFFSGSCKPIMMKLGDVTELNFNHNELKYIPASFGKYLRSVRLLDLSYNKLTTFPVCILNMPLVSLDISDNEVRDVFSLKT